MKGRRGGEGTTTTGKERKMCLQDLVEITAKSYGSVYGSNGNRFARPLRLSGCTEGFSFRFVVDASNLEKKYVRFLYNFESQQLPENCCQKSFNIH